MCILNENLVQKAMFILSRLENSKKVYLMKEKEIMFLLKKYDLLNEEFLDTIKNIY